MRLTGEVLYPSEIRIDLISLDSERGTADVDSCEVRKQFAILLLQLRMGPRDTRPVGPVFQMPRSQSQSNPSRAILSRCSSGISSSVAERPRICPSS